MLPADSFSLTGSGAWIPSRGIGTFLPDPSLYGPGSVKQAVLQALSAGYRHIDTALRYDNGLGEREVGEAVRESGILRREIFIVTKLPNHFHQPDDVEIAMDMSLRNLGLDYVDLYLMHFPYAYSKTDGFGIQRDSQNRPVIDIPLSRAFTATWIAMESLVSSGKAKHIGVSNFSTPKLRRLLLTCTIKPAVNQIEVHPYWPQKQLVQFCQENGIHVTAFGPLGCNPIPVIRGRLDGGPLQDPTIMAIASKYAKSPAQLCLCYLICRGLSVIPKSSNPERIVSNFHCVFELKEEDMAAIDNLMGANGERGVRNLETKDYLGFDNYNEETEEP